jgi:hypothetical protein
MDYTNIKSKIPFPCHDYLEKQHVTAYLWRQFDNGYLEFFFAAVNPWQWGNSYTEASNQFNLVKKLIRMTGRHIVFAGGMYSKTVDVLRCCQELKFHIFTSTFSGSFAEFTGDNMTWKKLVKIRITY